MKQAGLFNGRTFLSKVNGGKVTANYTPRKPVFRQGDLCDSLYYIEKGKVKLAVVSKRGKEAVVGLLGAGDFLGEECLAGQAKRLTTATPLTECVIVRLEKTAAIKALREDPEFSELFLAHLLQRNIRTQEDLVDQLFNSSEKRLARILLLLASYGKDRQPDLVIAKISQETLAEMVGTTRSRVNYFMNKFRRMGFIKYNGDLEVNSSLLSVVLYD
ncbi:MAG TPA: Crp/Fnr family transcriptional regulator [Bryobacteraceae bacterium]|jgi:CRP/FNR family cyclic AMP-dependent transcriptional regulator|nr:Crp/Fnr family transcriptional regulator [Bryobacteraceae bacterium]